jgi:hypothetical protein
MYICIHLCVMNHDSHTTALAVCKDVTPLTILLLLVYMGTYCLSLRVHCDGVFDLDTICRVAAEMSRYQIAPCQRIMSQTQSFG